MDLQRRLYRSSIDRKIAGVAGGLADYFGADPTIVRIVLAASLFLGIGVPLYFILWLVMPRDPEDFGVRIVGRIGLFGLLVRGLFLVIAGVIVAEVFESFTAVAFAVGLIVGLYILRRQLHDDAEEERGSRGLHRSTENKKILGVFGGLGETMGVDPTILRVIGAILAVVGAPGVIPLYFLYALIVPKRKEFIIVHA